MTRAHRTRWMPSWNLETQSQNLSCIVFAWSLRFAAEIRWIWYLTTCTYMDKKLLPVVIVQMCKFCGLYFVSLIGYITLHRVLFRFIKTKLEKINQVPTTDPLSWLLKYFVTYWDFLLDIFVKITTFSRAYVNL